MLASFLRGVALGFSAGVNPGPLTSLVITATLEGGLGSGIRVAIAPLITDLPIILISTLLVRALPYWAEVGLACIGGLYLFWLGYKTIMRARTAAPPQPGDAKASATQDFRQGIFVNFLSPNPWIFWITVGAPILLTSWSQSPAVAFAFLLGFYLLLVGGKVAIALALAMTRHRLNLAWYRGIFYASGALLLYLGVRLFIDGVSAAL